MEIKTNEIGDLLRSQIKNIDSDVDVNEVGEVLEVGGCIFMGLAKSRDLPVSLITGFTTNL